MPGPAERVLDIAGKSALAPAISKQPKPASQGRSIMHASGRTGVRLAALCLGLICALPASAGDDSSLYELQREWWQWAVSVPIGPNPIIDSNGRHCGVGQHGKYWFLAGNAGGTTTRSCTVPKGVVLVVPVITSFCYPEEGFDDDASCIEYIVNAFSAFGPTDLILRLDGKDLPFSQFCEAAVAPGDNVSGIPDNCRIRTRADRNLFTFKLAANSILPSTPGLWRANGANGYWALIDTRNLSLGNHVVRIKTFGEFFQDVKYNLTLARPTN